MILLPVSEDTAVQRFPFSSTKGVISFSLRTYFVTCINFIKDLRGKESNILFSYTVHLDFEVGFCVLALFHCPVSKLMQLDTCSCQGWSDKGLFWNSHYTELESKASFIKNITFCRDMVPSMSLSTEMHKYLPIKNETSPGIFPQCILF